MSIYLTLLNPWFRACKSTDPEAVACAERSQAETPSSGGRVRLEMERKVRKLESKALHETCYRTHDTSIQELAYYRYLQLGGTLDEWLAIKQKSPSNTLLHWITASWKCEKTLSAMNNTSSKHSARDQHMRSLLRRFLTKERQPHSRHHTRRSSTRARI
jgi:hypothetical protein